MYKILFLAIIFISLSIGNSFANTLIYKTPSSAVHLFSGLSHWTTEDPAEDFILTKKLSEEAQNILYSRGANEVWIAYPGGGNLKLYHSKDYGMNFNDEVATLKTNKANLKHMGSNNNALHLIYEEKGKYIYAFSPDSGNSWSVPKEMNKYFQVADSDLSINQDLLDIALLTSDGKTIYIYESIGSGGNFIQNKIESKIFSKLERIRLFRDSVNNIHLFAAGAGNLYHFKKNNREWTESKLFESGRLITYLKIEFLKKTNAILFNFTTDNQGEIENYWAVSQDCGESLSQPKKILSGDDIFLTLFYDEGKLFWASDKKLTEILNTAPSLPEIKIPNTIINSDKLNIKLNAFDADQDALFYRIDLSENDYFTNPISFYTTKEAQINPPFSSGIFFVKASACDGITYSNESKLPIKIAIDRVSPEIIAIDLPQNINNNSFNVKLTFSEPALFNGEPKFSLENTKFSSDLKTEILTVNSASLEALLSGNQIAEGTYNLKISNLCDLAGNPLKTSSNLIVKIDRQSPRITIAKPKAGDYFSANSIIVIEAQIEDMQNDLPAKPIASILIDQKPVSATLNFNESGTKLFGFLPLSKSFLNGKHILELQAKDRAGNTGAAQTPFSIDGVSPQIASPANPTDEKSKIILPFIEDGSGLDIDSSSIKISYMSQEVEGNISMDGNTVIFSPKTYLSDGKYTIETTLRDKAGNLSPAQLLTLTIQPYVAKAGVINKNNGLTFMQCGPNPFNPEIENWLLKYSLTSLSELNFYIFTINGKNIHRSQTTANPISWNGKNQFGEIVPNGVYLFALQITDISGNKELHRGKIIVLK